MDPGLRLMQLSTALYLCGSGILKFSLELQLTPGKASDQSQWLLAICKHMGNSVGSSERAVSCVRVLLLLHFCSEKYLH